MAHFFKKKPTFQFFSLLYSIPLFTGLTLGIKPEVALMISVFDEAAPLLSSVTRFGEISPL